MLDRGGAGALADTAIFSDPETVIRGVGSDGNGGCWP